MLAFMGISTCSIGTSRSRAMALTDVLSRLSTTAEAPAMVLRREGNSNCSNISGKKAPSSVQPRAGWQPGQDSYMLLSGCEKTDARGTKVRPA